MAMSLPVQVAIHNSIYTASRNSSSNSDIVPVEVCETCGQVIEVANNCSTGEIIFYIIVILIAIWGACKIVDWIIWR